MDSNLLGKLSIAFGIYMILLTGILHSKSLLTSKEMAFQTIEKRMLLEGKEQPADIESVYYAKRSKILKKSAIKLALGLSFFILGALLINKQSERLWLLSMKNIWVQLLYWLLFCAVALFITTEGYSNFIGCDYTWLFIFLTAGLFGFYSSYFYLTTKYKSLFLPSALVENMLISGIGGIISFGVLIVASAVLLESVQSLFDPLGILPIGFFASITFVNIFAAMMIKKLEGENIKTNA